MIELKNKEDCCGCGACIQRCPKQCIIMEEDLEGFLYPKINRESCINCGICENVCPIKNQNVSRIPLQTYASKNSNEQVRQESSSGGIFTLLAEQIIAEGGVVFGVKFNQHWESVHDYTESQNGIKDFRTSKYTQSIIGNSYKEVENFLKQDRKVLFTGTPCQIAGLLLFLRKHYKNLITMDFICHGTPSPGVFRWYLGEQLAKAVHKTANEYNLLTQPIPNIPTIDILAEKYGIDIEKINFRDKIKGWKNYSFTLIMFDTLKKKRIYISSTLNKHVFLRGFLQDLFLRPSCYQCPTKQLKSGSDITIGDCWGVESIAPQLNDDKGLSIILINTQKGLDFIGPIKMSTHEMDYQTICKYNPALNNNPTYKKSRELFYQKNKLTFFKKIKNICKISPINQFKIYLYQLLHH